MPRPRRSFVPTGPELERRILEAIYAAGGTLGRQAIRLAVDHRLKGVELDEATSSLVGRRLVRVEKTTVIRTSIHGQVIRQPVTLYTLTRRGARALASPNAPPG